MATPSQFRQYLIAQDEEGNNIEVTRSASQVGVLAFDIQRRVFVHCHVLLEPLNDRRIFEARGRKLLEKPHKSRARFFEYGEDEGNAFYITENVDGESVRSYLASQSVIPVWLAMSLTVQALEGMNALLDAGCPVPTQPLEVMRVWQNGANSIKAVVADFPMTEEPENSAIKPKQAKALFVEESQKLEILFSETMQRCALGDEAQMEAVRFSQALSSLLSLFTLEAKSSFRESISIFETMMPLPPAGVIAASLSPRPLIASFLKDSQTVARSLVQSVRIQSQKLDPVNPYVLKGKLIKSGQEVSIEQVPPVRMAGEQCRESLSQMLNLSKIGTFPNLLPVVFLNDSAQVECFGEPIVEGVALSEVLEARRALDVFEINLLLKNLNAALGNLVQSQRTKAAIRLEDIFLFTGSGAGKTDAAGLAKINLLDWPNFSIVLRSHDCLHSMSARGSNPAALLPAKPLKKRDDESLWHGGWLAALARMLMGLPDGASTHQRTGVPEIDAVSSLLDEEMKLAYKGNPSSRALFLSRYAKLIEKYAPAEVIDSEGWRELSGNRITQRQTEDVATNINRSLLGAEPVMSGDEHLMLGFAEALIQHPVMEEPEFIGGLRPMRAAPQALPHEDFESSWIAMHEKKPLWWHILWIIGGSMIIGIGLAHLSGRAFWQKMTPATAFEIEAMEINPGRGIGDIELPVPSVEVSKPSIVKLPTPGPLLKELDPGETVLMPDATKKTPPATMTLDAPNPQPKTISPIQDASRPPVTADTELTTQLKALRKSDKTIPLALREETEKAAKAGNKEAMIAMGNLFLRGEEPGRDELSAFQWFEKAIKSGEAAAMLPLAECYLQGWGTKQDYTQAATLLSKASSSGEPRAKDLLAVCYARGIGVTRDDAKALALFTEAYHAGIPSACGNLGAMYLRGQGTAPDAERAAKLFEEGAKKDHADSMLLYAQSLEYGTGITVNVAEARVWYLKAAKAGNAQASSWCRKNGIVY